MTTGSSHCAAKVLNYTSLRSAVDPNIYTLAICKMAISTPVFVIGL